MKFFKKSQPPREVKSYRLTNDAITWTPRNYASFANYGYIKNVIANRCIKIIATGAGSIELIVQDGNKNEITNHPINKLLKKPNNTYHGIEFIESAISYYMIAGNVYIYGILENGIKELHLLRPDRVSIEQDAIGQVTGYTYKVNKALTNYKIDPNNGFGEVLHIKNFHPYNDIYGLSQMEAAQFSIDQHNEAGYWNKSILENGARPSGALVVKDQQLTDHQFERLKDQIDCELKGGKSAGKIMLLDGGMEWMEMSISPKDMDFMQMKHSAARDIALAFGIPSQCLGIPGDNTYSNMSEARSSVWEDTIIPITQKYTQALSTWLSYHFQEELNIILNLDSISALIKNRSEAWKNVQDASFISNQEKRNMMGFDATKVS